MKLEPLRDALLAEADGEERRRLAEIDQTCEAQLARARARAERLTDRSRSDGERLAAQEARHRLGAAYRRGRESRLAAQRVLVDELLRCTLAAALAARDAHDPRYARLLERLARTARAQLGPDLELEVDPGGIGGVRARSGERSVDYTLPALVERALEGLGDEVAGLWR